MVATSDDTPLNSDVVLLTNGSSHGWRIAQALHERGIPIRAVVLETPPAQALIRRAAATVRGQGFRSLATVVGRRLGQYVRIRGPRRPTAGRWLTVTGELVRVPTLAGDECRSLLTQLRPAIGILGGAPIMPADIVRIPRMATLNAHPGLLPDYRGVDVVAWAIHNGDPVGVTIHVVDGGVDTGPTCRAATVPILPGDDLDTVRGRAEQVAGNLTAEVVAEALSAGQVRASPQPIRKPAYRRMDAATLRAVRARLVVD